MTDQTDAPQIEHQSHTVSRPLKFALDGAIIVCVILAILALCLSLPYGITGRSYQPDSVVQLYSAQLSTSQGGLQISLPGHISKDQASDSGEVILTASVHVDEDSYLYLYDSYAPLSLYVDEELVGTYGEEGTYPSFMKDPPPSAIMWKISSAEKTVNLKFVYQLPQSSSGLRLSPVYVGSLDALRYTLTRQMIFLFLAALVVGVLGIAAALISYISGLKSRLGHSYFWLGLFTLCVAAWIFGQTNITSLILRRPAFLYVLMHVGLFSAAIPCSRLMHSLTFDKPSKVFSTLVALVEIFVIASLILQLTGTLQFSQSLLVFYVLLTALIAYSSFHIGVQIFGKDDDEEENTPLQTTNNFNRFYLFSVMLIDVFLVLEFLNYYRLRLLPDMTLFVIGIILFMVVMMIGLALEVKTGTSAREREQMLALRLREVEGQVESERDWYNNFSESRRELRRQRNHLHYQLSSMRAYAEDGDTEGLIDFIDDLDAQIPALERAQYSDEFAVDAVVSYYVDMAHKEGIYDIDVRLGVTDQLPEDLEDDVCAVVGNLLKNAVIDARAALAEGNIPSIQMSSALLRGSLLNISMNNTYGGAPRDLEGDVSLRTIDACAQSRNGSARFEVHEDEKVLISSVIMRVRD